MWMQTVAFAYLVFVTLASAQEDFDRSLSHIGQQFVSFLGLNTKFVFTAGKNYPPIADDVTFWCIKPNGANFERVFANQTTDALKNVIDINLPMNFIIHGFLDAFHGGYLGSDHIGWMDTTGRKLANVTNSNVCAVDWSRLATYEYIITARSHTRKVSDHIVDFINILAKNGAQISDMTLIGHSLGAQIAGLVGGSLGGELKAIYGLDPAGPAFTFPFDVGAARRLDKTDAQYVQCIHTARLTLGVNSNCGHGDFYPDSGFKLPGCFGPVCSHLRVVMLFRSSLDRSNAFVGTHCNTDISARFRRYECSANRDSMGIYNQKGNGQYYLYTTGSEPFCYNCSATVAAKLRQLQSPVSESAKMTDPTQVATVLSKVLVSLVTK